MYRSKPVSRRYEINCVDIHPQSDECLLCVSQQRLYYMMNAKLSRKFLKFFEKFHHILFIRSKMAVFSLSIIGICQVAFIRKNAFDLLIVLFVLASLPQILFSMLLLCLQEISAMGSQESSRQPVHQFSGYLLYLITHFLKRIRRHGILCFHRPEIRMGSCCLHCCPVHCGLYPYRIPGDQRFLPCNMIFAAILWSDRIISFLALSPDLL